MYEINGNLIDLEEIALVTELKNMEEGYSEGCKIGFEIHLKRYDHYIRFIGGKEKMEKIHADLVKILAYPIYTQT